MANMRLLDPDDPEMRAAWEEVRLYFGGYTCHDPESGEVWQYMGTAEMERPTMHVGRYPGGSERVEVHTFRHRAFRRMGMEPVRVLFYVPSDGTAPWRVEGAVRRPTPPRPLVGALLVAVLALGACRTTDVAACPAGLSESPHTGLCAAPGSDSWYACVPGDPYPYCTPLPGDTTTRGGAR